MAFYAVNVAWWLNMQPIVKRHEYRTSLISERGNTHTQVDAPPALSRPTHTAWRWHTAASRRPNFQLQQYRLQVTVTTAQGSMHFDSIQWPRKTLVYIYKIYNCRLPLS